LSALALLVVLFTEGGVPDGGQQTLLYNRQQNFSSLMRPELPRPRPPQGSLGSCACRRHAIKATRRAVGVPVYQRPSKRPGTPKACLFV